MSLALAPALWGLLVLPVLVLLRILDRRPRVLVVPSLIPWRQAAAAAKPEGRRRLLLDWPLVLQLAAAAAVVLAAAGPRVGGKPAGLKPVVVVLDNSASMGARSADGADRFGQARQRILKELTGQKQPLTRLTAAVATAPEPRAFTSGDFGVPFGQLGEVRLVPSAGDLAGAVAAARAAGGSGAQIVVAADDLSPIEHLPGGDLLTIRVGSPVRNLGIVAAAVEDGRLFAAVRNASVTAEKARLTVRYLDRGKEADARDLDVAPGGRTYFTFQLPADLTGRVELRLPPDDLEADNVVSLSAKPPPRPLFAGRPASSFARALQALGFQAASAPAAAEKSPAAVMVSCGQWPKPGSWGLFTFVIDPPAGDWGGITAGDQTAPAEIRLGEGAPEFFPGAGSFSFRAPSVRKLKPGGGRVLLGTAEQPLIVLSAAGSECVLAFDPEATDWVKHESFPVFLARLAERHDRFGALCREIRTEGLLSDEETSCRVAGQEVRETAPAGRPLAVAGGRPLAPWLFALALVLLAAEWWLASRPSVKS